MIRNPQFSQEKDELINHALDLINKFFYGENYCDDLFHKNKVFFYGYLYDRMTFDELLIELDVKITEDDILLFYTALKEYSKKQYKCIYPLCERVAIGSHNMQENGVLKRLNTKYDAKNILEDHVYMPMLVRSGKYESTIAVKKCGIATQATVFPGFCSMQ